jgi:hypothetical protein
MKSATNRNVHIDLHPPPGGWPLLRRKIGQRHAAISTTSERVRIGSRMDHTSPACIPHKDHRECKSLRRRQNREGVYGHLRHRQGAWRVLCDGGANRGTALRPATRDLGLTGPVHTVWIDGSLDRDLPRSSSFFF